MKKSPQIKRSIENTKQMQGKSSLVYTRKRGERGMWAGGRGAAPDLPCLLKVEKMTKLEDHMEGIINVFHQYSVRVGHYDKLSKGEMKQLITKELPNTLKNTKDQATIDKTFQDLDADKDGQIDFSEFVNLVVRVLLTAHEDIHKE
uniref:EF-hand domain-containing protein n=2 Tax=Ursus TaxID=9639 RepID=A0A452QGB2_URSAM